MIPAAWTLHHHGTLGSSDCCAQQLFDRCRWAQAGAAVRRGWHLQRSGSNGFGRGTIAGCQRVRRP
jgi:hypothetical protein